MDVTEIFTADQFAQRNAESTEFGRWSELVDGVVRWLEPPDAVHGNTVLNLAKGLSSYLEQRRDENPGQLRFEHGLLLKRDPGTVLFPAMSYHASDTWFSESTGPYTESPPQLVVDIASTNARRRNLSNRIEMYHRWGVEMVWVADTEDRFFFIAQNGTPTRQLMAHESLFGDPVLAGFHVHVGALFADPEWWTT